MSLFDDVIIEKDGIEEEADRVGGGGFASFDKTGKYDVEIEYAYVDSWDSGALFACVKFKREDGATTEIKESITNKSKQNYYLDKDGNKKFLPSYSRIMAIDFLLTKSSKDYPKTAKKTITIQEWNKDTKKFDSKDVEKDVFIEWTGKPLTILGNMVLANKQAKNAEGKYVDTPEQRKPFFEVTHFLDAVTNKTKNETIAGIGAELVKKWEDKFDSEYVKDIRTYKDTAGSTGSEPTHDSDDDIF